MGDQRWRLLEQMSPTMRLRFHESTCTLTRIEGYFSTLASYQGGPKPTPRFICERSNHLDVLTMIKADLEKGFSTKISKKRWKDTDNYREGFNDGTETFGGVADSAFFKLAQKRTRQSTKNKSNPRSFARAAGGTNG